LDFADLWSEPRVGDTFRVVQLTPTHLPSSIAFGKGFVATERGSAQHLVLVVDDIDAVREDLISRGVAVTEVLHDDAQTHAPVPDPDPQGRCCRRSRRGFRDGSGTLTIGSLPR